MSNELITMDLESIAELLTEHINRVDNPHKVKPADLNLGNVDNTSDMDKPVSTATQALIDKTNTNINNIQTTLNNSFNKLKKDIESKIGEVDLNSLQDSLTNEIATRKTQVTTLTNTINEKYEYLTNLISNTKLSLTKDISTNTKAIEDLSSSIEMDLQTLTNTIEVIEKNLQAAIDSEITERKNVDNELNKKVKTEIEDRKTLSGHSISVGQDAGSHSVRINLLNSDKTTISSATINLNEEHILTKVTLVNKGEDAGKKLLFSFNDGHELTCSLQLLMDNLLAQLNTNFDIVMSTINHLSYTDTDKSGEPLGHVTKTLTKITQTKGLISATYEPIKINIDQVNELDNKLNENKEYINTVIDNLDVSAFVIGTNETLLSISEQNGKIKTESQKIAISQDQITDFATTSEVQNMLNEVFGE